MMFFLRARDHSPLSLICSANERLNEPNVMVGSDDMTVGKAARVAGTSLVPSVLYRV
jgi:hypothetical protein